MLWPEPGSKFEGDGLTRFHVLKNKKNKKSHKSILKSSNLEGFQPCPQE